MSSANAPRRMTADEFLAWAMEQPEGEHYELVDGEVIGMAPERLSHARIKGIVFQALRLAIRTAGVACEAVPDGMSVRVDAETVFEPDAMVYCGPRLDGNAIEVPAPAIVVEVVSPSSHKRDSGTKLESYFRIDSVRHYLIVTIRNRAVIHHERNEHGNITTRIIRDGPIRLDPPGIELTGLFEEMANE
jgi:Uma2 family endonuclease